PTSEDRWLWRPAGGVKQVQSLGRWVEVSPEIPQMGAPLALWVTPLPLKEMVAGELLALLATETLPVTLPAAVGAKVTFSVAVWPGVSVALEPTPLEIGRASCRVRVEIVTLEFPPLVSVIPNEGLTPTFTFPKLKLLGLAVNWLVAETPAPVRAIVVGELLALLATETLPVTPPAAVGAKVTFSVVVWPGVSVVLEPTPLAL